MEIILFILMSIATYGTDLDNNENINKDAVPELSLAQKCNC